MRNLAAKFARKPYGRPAMNSRPSTLGFCSLFALQVALLACVKNPQLAPGKMAPRVLAPAIATVPGAPAGAPAPPPTYYDCAVPGAPVVGDDVERICVPYAGQPKGDAQALVTIVMFSDFQCPFCARVRMTLDQLEKEYPGKLRAYFRHNPLPFHDKAKLAAQAGVAAERQNKFWAMHDVLFENQSKLARENLTQYAKDIGLDQDRFIRDLDSAEALKQVEEELELGKKLGVQGTPSFFINGRPVRGAVPVDQFKVVIDDELNRAQKLGPKAATGYAFYAALMNGEGKGLGKPMAQAPPPKIPVGAEVYRITLGQVPQKGGQEPKVTLVEFGDFQCPYCARAQGTLDELLKFYKDDIRIAFLHYPLPFHMNAAGAALAAIAAEEQGKFWQMHDRLFHNQQKLAPEELEKHAEALALDMSKYRAAIADPKNKARVQAEMKTATILGVGGTPSFFLNGHAFSGAYPLASFKTLIDEEIKKVDALLAAGLPRAQLYATLIEDGLDKAAPKKEEERPGEPQPGVAYKVDILGAPIKGAKDALVTIVEYADFECPFCARVEVTLDQVLKEYAGKVRVAWHNLPLPFHERAKPSAIAAMAAHRQGKFWQMHDLLFKNQQNLGAEELGAEEIESYAKQIGLNLAKFKAALTDERLAKAMDAEVAAGGKIGARGTPAFFINGTFLSGAQPFERFQERIDEELTKAKSLVKKGTPRAKVYDTIMKHAKTEVATPSDAASVAINDPPKKVEVDNAPARGSKEAPITVVVFSDFQCPFCSQIEPTLVELEQLFPGKVRVVWKNFPLSFHNRAKPAAEAALAANEQGKFWQMHATIFKNQNALEDADLEGYAEEIGLDMEKFRAATASHKFAAALDADMKQGSALGVEGTPATFVNGRLVSGAQPVEVFKEIVEKELKKPSGK
jgi:protein-disulfide isomerase